MMNFLMRVGSIFSLGNTGFSIVNTSLYDSASVIEASVMDSFMSDDQYVFRNDLEVYGNQSHMSIPEINVMIVGSNMLEIYKLGQ